VAALVGTVFAVSQPPLRVHRGVVGTPSLVDSLRYAIEGSLGGIVVVVGALAIWYWVRYLLVGDPVWKAEYRYARGATKNILSLELRCRSKHPVDPSILGSVECLIKTPSGAVQSSDRLTTEQGRDGKRPWLEARFRIKPEHGRYRCRWYSATEGTQTCEVARATVRSPQDEPPTAKRSF
jgi:hypothetical protein